MLWLLLALLLLLLAAAPRDGPGIPGGAGLVWDLIGAFTGARKGFARTARVRDKRLPGFGWAPD